jgi:prepilin peptidase CpaA
MPDEINAIAFIPGHLLVITVALATLSDVVTHRIPNVLLAPALSLALLTGAVIGGATGIALSLAGMGVGLALLLPVYAMGAMGAGDVKLLGVAGAFLGPHGALIAGLMTFVAGAVLGLLWIGWRALRPAALYCTARIIQSIRRDGAWVPVAAATERNNKFAYAPAIASGVAFAVWQQGWIIPTVMGS